MWKPEVGSKVKMSMFCHYTQMNLHPWGWFVVMELLEEGAKVHTILEGAGVERRELILPYDKLQKPLGWSKVYEVCSASKQKAEETLAKFQDWLQSGRNVAVWTSHDFGTAGRFMYTPGDCKIKPHWSMELVEVVNSMDRFHMSYEEMTPSRPSDKEKREKGWKYDRHTKEWYRTVSL